MLALFTVIHDRGFKVPLNLSPGSINYRAAAIMIGRREGHGQ